MSNLEGPELKSLAQRLPATILHSRADSTVKKYLGAFRRWKTWATSHNLVPIHAKPHEVALYLQHLGDKTRSKSAAEEACNALAWIHSSAGIASPSTHPFVKAVLGVKRTHARPVIKKEPLTVEMLQIVVDDAERSGSLSDLRLATAILSFAAFLRFEELVELRLCDIIFAKEMITVKIRRSKGDQLRQGDEVLIARIGSKTCRVAMLERYMARTSTSWIDQRFLFRPIQRSKNGEELRSIGQISYSCLRDLFKT